MANVSTQLKYLISIQLLPKLCNQYQTSLAKNYRLLKKGVLAQKVQKRMKKKREQIQKKRRKTTANQVKWIVSLSAVKLRFKVHTTHPTGHSKLGQAAKIRWVCVSCSLFSQFLFRWSTHTHFLTDEIWKQVSVEEQKSIGFVLNKALN